MLRPVDHQRRGRVDVIGLGILLEPRKKSGRLLLVLQTLFHLILAQTGGFTDLAQVVSNLNRVAVADPVTLLLVEHIGDTEKPLFSATTGNHRRPKAETVEVNVAIDQSHIAAFDILGLQFLARPIVERRTMRASERGVFNHGHRRIFGPEGNFDDTRGVDLASVFLCGGGPQRYARRSGRGAGQPIGRACDAGEGRGPNVEFALHVLPFGQRFVLDSTFWPSASSASRSPVSPTGAASSLAVFVTAGSGAAGTCVFGR